MSHPAGERLRCDECGAEILFVSECPCPEREPRAHSDLCCSKEMRSLGVSASPAPVRSAPVGGGGAATLATELLWRFEVTFGPMQTIGMTPHGMRVFVPVLEGTFEGPRIRGTVLPGGSDAALVRPDGTVDLDIRAVALSDDGPIYMTAFGLQVATPEVSLRLQQGQPVDASEYYMRAAYRFETASQRYAWLNQILGVAIYRRTARGLTGDVFAIR